MNNEGGSYVRAAGNFSGSSVCSFVVCEVGSGSGVRVVDEVWCIVKTQVGACCNFVLHIL